MEKLKVERIAQWGNNNKTPRGWDRYRCSTFLEVIGAKLDRATQAQQQLTDLKDHPQKNQEVVDKIKKLEEDGIDSLMDAQNYLEKCLKKIKEDRQFYISNVMQ